MIVTILRRLWNLSKISLTSLESTLAKRSRLDEKGWNKIEKLVREFNLYMVPFLF